jgi:hypothetical protein
LPVFLTFAEVVPVRSFDLETAFLASLLPLLRTRLAFFREAVLVAAALTLVFILPRLPVEGDFFIGNSLGKKLVD